MIPDGNLYILTAPSGAGKTTLANKLVTTTPNIQLSISYTTRPPRVGEQSGVHYWFIDAPQFQTMIEKAAFLEYARVHDYYYGTSRERTEAILKTGSDVVLAIDWQGAQHIRQIFKDAVSIFILPPSKDLLQKRLQLRGQDNTTVIARRLAAAANEVSHYTEFEYMIVNDVFEEALQDLQSIVRTHQLLRSKQALRHAKLLVEWLPDR